MTVKNITEAWEEANKLFPTDYEKDYSASERAGYDIYRHPTLNYYCRICDLGNRLEVLTGENGENVTNIWIVSDEEEATAAETQTEAEPQPEYGSLLAEKIRTETTDFSKLTDYEKFILDRGYEFKTDEELKAGYDRLWKCGHGVLLTEAEFVIEAGKYYEVETLKATYAALCKLVEEKKMRAGEVYSYARFGWCLRNPEAIVAYEEGRDKWEVNNCSTVATEDEAKEAINSEWGFESSRVQIIGTPYYDATDYQFIRFDCGHMTWLWKNGNLYQVYAD